MIRDGNRVGYFEFLSHPVLNRTGLFNYNQIFIVFEFIFSNLWRIRVLLFSSRLSLPCPSYILKIIIYYFIL